MIKGGGPILDGAIPGLVVLGSIRKQAEQASKEHPSMASASDSNQRPALNQYRLVLCVNLTQAGVITEKGASGEEMPP